MKKRCKQWQTIFLGSKITVDGDCSHEIKGHLLLGRKAMTTLEGILKSRDTTLPTIVGFSSSHVRVWELDHKEGWALKNWCFWTVILEKSLESPLDCKEIKPVNPEGNQSWLFIARTDAEAPIIWLPDVKSWLIRKDPDAGKDCGWEDRGWDGWMTSPTQWAWIWVNSRSWWWIGRPGVLQSRGSQSQTWLSEWTELNNNSKFEKAGREIK